MVVRIAGSSGCYLATLLELHECGLKVSK